MNPRRSIRLQAKALHSYTDSGSVDEEEERNVNRKQTASKRTSSRKKTSKSKRKVKRTLKFKSKIESRDQDDSENESKSSAVSGVAATGPVGVMDAHSPIPERDKLMLTEITDARENSLADQEDEMGDTYEQETCEETEFLSLDSEDPNDSLVKKVPLRNVRFTTNFAPKLQPQLEQKGTLIFDKMALVNGRTRGQPGFGSLVHSKDSDEVLMKKSVFTPEVEQRSVAPVRKTKYQLEKMRKAEREKTAGSGWFNLPAPVITPELKNDLKVLQLRGALDPKQHYKKNDSKKPPRYFQVGRVVGGPTDFYSGRVPKRQQKNTIVEELLSNEKLRQYQKKKYTELQKKFQSGRQRYRGMKKGKYSKYKK